MGQDVFLSLMKQALMTVLMLSAPALGVAIIVGLSVGLFQALTQIQEMTLTFVPKIVAIFVVLGLSATFIGSQLSIFTEQVYSRIEHQR